ncbi:IucA/IucC family protein [Kitasatospora sp. NPDC059571]|uniref:IucA/IucC family protein n=1 Tax=Kitasatospora sp. NPDC059571 TaxID=3346871 RepID=UPI00369E288B
MTTRLDARRCSAPDRLPTADEAVAHTLLNCLLREVSAPEHQTAVVGDRLLVRLPRRGSLLRIALRRTSLSGAHRFTGPVLADTPDGPRELGWRELAEHVQDELALRGGIRNEEFLEQLAASHAGVAAGLADRPAPGPDRYLESEQALLFGHRFHPAPKSRSADRAAWAAWAPEARAAFRLRHLAVRADLLAGEAADPEAADLLDRLGGRLPDGYRLLPAHPWQYRLLTGHPLLTAALERGDVLDLGPQGDPFTATASVRTLHGAGAFLKFSLNVRITNCLRKNAAYELRGAVALTRLLAGPLADLARRHPGAAVLREPAFRTLALPGPDGRPDTALFEGFGLIVRDGLAAAVRPGLTPLLAAAVADEYPTSSAHVSVLLGGGGPGAALDWWARYLRLLVPPVLDAYLRHGIVLEPHLQNVLVCVDGDGRPAQVVLRDLEGTKLLPERHAAALAALPPEVAGPMTYDADRGWDRVVYCLVVNHLSELLATLADQAPPALAPRLEVRLWRELRTALAEFADQNGRPARLTALLDGAPLPAKANLLTRWERRADREAGYIRLPSPLAPSVLAEAARPRGGQR